MMQSLLSTIDSPRDLRRLNLDELRQLAEEMRAALCHILELRSAHFASNLGVVELCLALHRVFDFAHDRIVWDTGHQIYPQKLITGRYRQIDTIRTKGGLMGYPNPAESPYDQFMTGHAGCSVSCALGLKTADDLLGRRDRRTVAVIGDGALPSGIVFEALNNGGELGKDLMVVLNDNRMSICPRVGALARYLEQARVPDFPEGLRRGERPWQPNNTLEEALARLKRMPEAAQPQGRLFEELGWRYVGPVDGHNLPMLVKCFEDLRNARGPLLVHLFTEKGHGFEPAVQDPVRFHAPPQFRWNGKEVITSCKKSAKAYTNVASEAIYAAMKREPKVVVITAAMCEGNKLPKQRAEMPERFFDTGICEAHAVAFAAGLAKNGARPIAAIYSTFLQRAYDQLFQEVALQNLPVTFCLDRAGLTGPDGPTHHGVFDTVYMRALPNFTVMAPGDELDLPLMLDFALQQPGPGSLRYPKANVDRVARTVAPIELGQAEVIAWGRDGMLVAYGTLLKSCVEAAERLCDGGLDVGVINARFAKPIDTRTILRAIADCGFVLTVEEGTLQGGFGSGVLEAANEAGLDTRHVRRRGLPDRFIEHAERHELLHDLGLDADGIYQQAVELAERGGFWSGVCTEAHGWEPASAQHESLLAASGAK
ncbi:MAG: 1-deoxy-D-xylulose-5-phosphate synthase [Planctomycetes bacterium]|nr:1-deoxy-D-xylulose-5-phosphate synthase [Planctomycetota bacterium]